MSRRPPRDHHLRIVISMVGFLLAMAALALLLLAEASGGLEIPSHWKTFT